MFGFEFRVLQLALEAILVRNVSQDGRMDLDRLGEDGSLDGQI